MLFSKLIFFHKPVAKGVCYLLFSLCGWVLYPKELSLFQDWPHLSSVNLNPFLCSQIAHKHIELFLGSILLTRKRKKTKQLKMEVSIPWRTAFNTKPPMGRGSCQHILFPASALGGKTLVYLGTGE